MTNTLDRIALDGLRVKAPSGRDIVPHAGQSVWVYAYGRTIDEGARARRAISLLGSDDAALADEALTEVCAFLASEIDHHDVLNFRTGTPYGQATATELRGWPDDLVAYLARKMFGLETEGEGPAASGGSPDGSTPEPATEPSTPTN